MHPVDPSNTATSVAAAALALNIRRLVLFAFIGRAFHLGGWQASPTLGFYRDRLADGIHQPPLKMIYASSNSMPFTPAERFIITTPSPGSVSMSVSAP